MSSTARKRRGGQAAIMMVLNLTMLFGLVGLSVDLGFSYYQKQAAQAAADSGVLASAAYARSSGSTCGSNGLVCNSTPTVCTNFSTGVLYIACQYANTNGFPMSAISVSANTGTPASAPGTTPTYWIKVTVATTNRNYFGRFAGFTTSAINAESTSGVIPATAGTGYCLVALDTSNYTKSFWLTGQVTLNLNGCHAQVNSIATDAADANGQNTINGTIDVVGGSQSGNQVACASNPPFHCAASTMPDPLLSLPALVAGSADLSATTCATGTSGSSGLSITTNTALSPGIYCGGVHISGGTVTFASGNYMMKDGGLIIDNGTTSGTNVMFYFTTTNHATTADPLLQLNTSAITFSAPGSGTYKGILFYGDRAAPADSAGNVNILQAQSSPTISGTMYFPKGNFKMSGQAGISGYVAIVANHIDLESQSTFNWDSTGTYTGLAPAAKATLIE